jgi:S-formylglutathione hydrolase FrmB
MSRIEFSYRSAALGYRTTVTAVIPSVDWIEMMRGTDGAEFYDQRYPVLWLLHGTSGDNDCWTRFTRLESWAEQHRIAVIMPDCRLSAFTDMNKGPAYSTFLTEELPRVCRSMFPLLEAREDNFIGGLSMGGYGALKVGLRHPERYSLIVNLSGGVDRVTHVKRAIAENRQTGLHNLNAMQTTFGDLSAIEGSDNDVFALAEKLAGSGRPKPRIFTSIGTNDPHWDENIRLRTVLVKNDYDLHWEQGPYIHDWTNWNHYIEIALQWISDERSGKRKNITW